jgi:hypothetical protein
MNALGFVAELEHWISSGARDKTDRALETRTTWFSDNVGISTPLPGDAQADRHAAGRLCQVLAALQAHFLLEFGVLCRGGVVIGDCFHDNNVIFGPGLVQAVRLEWAAGTPRVVLSKEVADLVVSDLPLLDAEPLRQRPDVAVAANAVSLDYLAMEVLPLDNAAQLLADATIAVEHGLANAPETARLKWQWTAERLERAARARKRESR